MTGLDTTRWEFIDHAADVGISIRADSLQSLFVAAGRALMEWIGPAPSSGVNCSQTIHLHAEETEELLVRWLQEVLYCFHRHHAYFKGVEEMTLSSNELDCRMAASVWDETDCANYQEVKAVTYHHLQIKQDSAGWHATVILDI